MGGKRRWRLPALALPPADDPRVMAVALAILFSAGSAIGAVTLLLPHPDGFNDDALWANVTLSAGAGIVVSALVGRLPVWVLQIGVALGTVVITRAIYFSGEPGGFYAFYYFWVGLYAFFFFGRFWGTVHLTLMSACYAWVLNQVAGQNVAAGRWLIAVFTISISGVLVDVLARRMRQRRDEAAASARALAAVDSVAHELARRTTFDSAAPAICDAAVEVADGAGASLWQPTPDGSGLRATASTDREFTGTAVLMMGEPSGVIQAFNSRRALFVPDAPSDPSVSQRIVEELGAKSALFQPIILDQNPIGVLAVYWTDPVESIDGEVAQVVALLAAEAAIAIERTELVSRLERAARTDDLTGLPNRRAWDEYLAREIRRAERFDAPLCVAMVDLDHFKDYNDRHGHQAGDRLLKQAAASWQEEIRGTDFLARYGGEEFAAALFDCDLVEATATLERLRGATPQGESSSAGVVCWDGEESEAELVARADRALYAAKRAGRNRVIAAS